MRNRVGGLFVAAGLLLILGAMLLYLHNVRENRDADENAQLVLQEMQTQLVTPVPVPDATPSPRPEKTEMPVVEIDGREYIGYIAVPALEIELPVMADWSYEKLRIAPCRHAGATYTHDLVIAAHNYDSHFGGLKDLYGGAAVTFTDMDGDVFTYAVSRVETVAPTAVAEVLESDSDLVLYTCTYGGKTRVVVYCNEA